VLAEAEELGGAALLVDVTAAEVEVCAALVVMGGELWSLLLLLDEHPAAASTAAPITNANLSRNMSTSSDLV
jgi:hypothetical protein